MKALTKLIICAILSLSIGVACATPLLVTELGIRPFIKQVQGPTANDIINAVYANFTIINESTPITQYTGPNIAYYIVLNITNPSSVSAQLRNVIFTAASSNKSSTAGSLFMSGASGQGYTLEGAWVDDKWYNVTWAAGAIPEIDMEGKMVSTDNSSDASGYWMQGVQLNDVYVNGTLTYTYMNMNGTWRDVTNQIDVTHPAPINPFARANSLGKTIVNEHYVFVSAPPITSSPVTDKWAPWVTQYVLVGDGRFNEIWAPHQSRLILLSGIYEVRQPFGDASVFDALQSGNITLQTKIMDVADGMGTVNNTFTDTSEFPMEQKQILLTQSGDSYIYNAILGGNQRFETDQWGVEVFVK
jgi:hypothetical protein